jgi:hypothetical protein
MSKCWLLDIGEFTGTDDTLTLTNPNNETKEALIESDFWFCLSSLINLEICRINWLNTNPFHLTDYIKKSNEYPIKIDDDSYTSRLCELIWNNFGDESEL